MSAHDAEQGYVDNKVQNENWIMRTWRRPMGQVLLVSFIFFLLPGMYNALTGMGGSGQVDSTVAANANVGVLAGTAGTAFWLAPVMFDILGPRFCLLAGGWGYGLYSGSLLAYNKHGNGDFVIASGGLLGICAAFLWISQGSIMISYPSPETKGRAIAIFWLIFNLGGSIGSFASFGLNYDNSEGTVTDSTYIAYLVLMIVGWGLCVLVANPRSVIRSDGTHIPEPERHTNLPIFQRITIIVKREVVHFWTTLTNWRIICLLPMFFSANYFYSYQQNIVNGEVFNLRSRALNSAWYWLAQCFGGFVYGFLLDFGKLSRPTRSKCAWALLTASSFAIWGGGYAFQKWDDKMQAQGYTQWIDFKDSSNYAGPGILYMFYGGFDAAWQSTCYYLMGAIFDDPSSIAKAIGLYKTFQATGGAVAWRINALDYTPMSQFAINWGLVGGSLAIAIPTVFMGITPIEPHAIENGDDNNNNDNMEKKDSYHAEKM